MIRVESLNRVFRTRDVETVALNDVSLTIEDGEFVSIVGPSGSGKSTLLNILGFIDTAQSGSYKFNDSETIGLSESSRLGFRRQVGFIFQSFNLIDNLSVRENVRVSLLHKGISSSEQNRRIHDMLERLGIAHRSDHKPYQLSGGQQQRAAIARALVGNPKLLLADEPTGNLDSRNGEEIFALLKELNNSGSTIAMVTHDSDLAGETDRQVGIKDGRVLN